MRPIFYVTGGTLPSDAPCYVERQADRELLDALLDAQFCYVLDTRQVGKSSLVERTARNLRERGVAVAKIDLTTTGKEVSAAQWYNGMLRQVADSLQAAGMPDYWDDLRGFWRDNSELGPMQRWVEALRAVVLANSDTNLVIFVDEIESVRSFDFTDEFFAGIRACYNRRVDDPALRRLTFCLAGSATPEELIHSVTSTPFNIGHAITLSDFTREEAAILASGLADRALLDRVLYWTNGHPYLTQRLCAEITEADTPTTDLPSAASADFAPRPSSPPDARLVDALCRRLFLAPEARKSEKNLAFVAKRILDSPLDRAGLLDLYGRVRRGRVINDDKDALQSTLRLSGVARARNGRLTVRNRIYARVFDPAWIRENMPNAEVHRQRATAWRVGLSIGSLSAVVLAAMSWLTFRAVRAESLANTNATLAQRKTREATQNAERADRTAYFTNMNLIQREWETHNVPRVLELLAETEKYKNKGFEWGYWNRLAHLDLVTMKSSMYIMSVACSADDQWILTMQNGFSHETFLDWKRHVSRHDGLVKLWNARTGQEMLKEKTLGDASGAFSRDGRRIVTGSVNGTVKVFDVLSGNTFLKLKGHVGAVTSVGFSPDGKRILTGSEDKTAKVWDAETGRELLTLKGEKNRLWSKGHSADAARLCARTGKQ